MCNAGFKLVKVHESYEPVHEPYDKNSAKEMDLKKLPGEFTILAIK